MLVYSSQSVTRRGEMALILPRFIEDVQENYRIPRRSWMQITISLKKKMLSQVRVLHSEKKIRFNYSEESKRREAPVLRCRHRALGPFLPTGHSGRGVCVKIHEIITRHHRLLGQRRPRTIPTHLLSPQPFTCSSPHSLSCVSLMHSPTHYSLSPLHIIHTHFLILIVISITNL